MLFLKIQVMISYTLYYYVNLSSRGRSAGNFRSGGKSRIKGGDDIVIEAEIIDKETRQ
jgi:hypothetical protein